MKEHQYVYGQSDGIVPALMLLSKAVKDQRQKGWRVYGPPVYAGIGHNHVWVQSMIQEEDDALRHSD